MMASVSLDKQVRRCDPIGVIAEERLPPLGWGSPVHCHVLGERGLTDVDAELEEFSIREDTPSWIEIYDRDSLVTGRRACGLT